MKNLLKSKLVGNTAIYALANVLNGVIPFLLLPVLTRVLSPAEYGLVTLFTSVIAIMGAFTGLSVHGAVSVRFFDKNINHPKFLGASLAVLLVSTSFVLLIMLALGHYISNLIHLPFWWLIIGTLASAAQFIITIRLIMWQVKKKPLNYGIFQISQTLLNYTLSLIFVFWLIGGWEGRSTGIVLTLFSFSFLAIASLHKDGLVGWSWDSTYMKDALHYGVPLIPHVIGGFVMSMSDRFIISSYTSVADLGNYSVALMLIMPMSILIDAFMKAYSPWIYEKLNSGYAKKRLVGLSYGFFILIIIFAGIYSLSAEFLVKHVVGSNFSSAIIYIPWLLFASAFTGMYYIVGIYISYAYKTKILSVITLTTGIVHFILCTIMVKTNGAIGAAQSVLITNIFMFLITWFLASKVYPMNWLARNAYLNTDR